jgi:hypothetical protein
VRGWLSAVVGVWAGVMALVAGVWSWHKREPHRSQLTSWSSKGWSKPEPEPAHAQHTILSPLNQVVHRFSEWRDLNKRLGAVFAASAYGGRPLPYFPARLPFGGASIVARRQCAHAHPACPAPHTPPARFASHSQRTEPTRAAPPSGGKHRRASCKAQR